MIDLHDWLMIVVIEFKYIKICGMIIAHVIFAKIEAAKLKMSIFVFMTSIDLIIHVMSAKIEAAGPKTPIFVRWGM